MKVFRAVTLVATIAAVALGAACRAQTASPAAAGTSLADPLAAVADVAPQVNTALESTTPQKWKVKPEQHDLDARNYLSIHSDLEKVLPGLLQAAVAQPHSVGAGVAVYRNVNALYDVLVRVQQTAALASKEDGATLQDALTRLEIVRGQLADKIIALANEQQNELATARQQLAAAAEKPKHIVADDAAPLKKPAAKKPAAKAAKPSAATAANTPKPAPTQPQQQ
jgi:hypothetical protein